MDPAHFQERLYGRKIHGTASGIEIPVGSPAVFTGSDSVSRIASIYGDN
jgi:hypothetical protein